MRYLTLNEVLVIHRQLVQVSGGTQGIRDLGGLESAIAQPRMTFGGEELYPTVVEKAVALGYSIIMNHPFVDGNKRAGHAALEVFLVLNGYEVVASDTEQERLILSVAAGQTSRMELEHWVRLHLTER